MCRRYAGSIISRRFEKKEIRDNVQEKQTFSHADIQSFNSYSYVPDVQTSSICLATPHIKATSEHLNPFASYHSLHYIFVNFTRHLHQFLSDQSWCFNKVINDRYIIVGECKQIEFQLLFQSICIRDFLETEWMIFPCFRSGKESVPIAELALQ